MVMRPSAPRLTGPTSCCWSIFADGGKEAVDDVIDVAIGTGFRAGTEHLERALSGIFNRPAGKDRDCGSSSQIEVLPRAICADDTDNRRAQRDTLLDGIFNLLFAHEFRPTVRQLRMGGNCLFLSNQRGVWRALQLDGIDMRASRVKISRDASLYGRTQHVSVNQSVIAHHLGRPGEVVPDTADLGGQVKNDVDALANPPASSQISQVFLAGNRPHRLFRQDSQFFLAPGYLQLGPLHPSQPDGAPSANR